MRYDSTIEVKTQNVKALTLLFPSGTCPINLLKNPAVNLNGLLFRPKTPKLDRSLTVHFHETESKPPGGKGGWEMWPNLNDRDLLKRHGLQGPIDDAFWESFVFVTPSGQAINPAVGKWVEGELEHAVREWRKQFRGDAPQKKDNEVTSDVIARSNLILWGDPSSNAVLKKIADKLPIKWTGSGIDAGGKQFSAGEHVPLLIYPNPLNPHRYVVLNSGFTYREYDYLNNARQVPKLPDWAIVNLSKPPDAVTPGNVIEAGFFDENWRLK